VDGFLAQLAKRLCIPDADIITGDEVRDWPDGKLEELLAEGILQEIEPGTTVVCDQCDEHCSIEPQRRTDPRTGKMVGVHICLREKAGGRIEINLDRLRRWRINKRKLSQLGYTGGKGRTASDQGRQEKRKNEALLLRTALLEHHGFGSGNIRFKPTTQQEIAEQLRWKQCKVSRVITRDFPHGFWERYKLACQSDALIGFLTQLDESTNVEPVSYRPHHPTEHEEQDADHYN
jgi:hypothetical protein